MTTSSPQFFSTVGKRLFTVSLIVVFTCAMIMLVLQPAGTSAQEPEEKPFATGTPLVQNDIALGKEISPTATPAHMDTTQSLTPQSEQRSVVMSAIVGSNGPGGVPVTYTRGYSGLIATVFMTAGLATPIKVFSYTAPIDFALGCTDGDRTGCKLIPEIQNGGYYGVRWQGSLLVPITGTYAFTFTKVDDSGRLTIDASTILTHHWDLGGQREDTGTLALNSGIHPIIIEYQQWAPDSAELQITWSGPTFSDEVIPLAAMDRDRRWGPGCPLCSDTDNSVGGPINTFNGNYNYMQQDISIPALGQPLLFKRSYNAQSSDLYTNTSTMGYGWTHNYNIRLIASVSQPGGEAGVIVFQGWAGGRFRFLKNDKGSTVYQPLPGVQATLTRTTTTPYIYHLVTADQTRYIFNAAGLPIQILDPRGNVTNLTYSGNQLTRVADATGQRYLNFGYDGQGRIITITDPISRLISYTYDPIGNLVLITNTQELTWTYTYTGANGHLLYEVYGPQHVLVERTDYEATGNRAVRQWTNASSQPLQIQYLDHIDAFGFPALTVVITDPANHVTSDDYNARGTLIGQHQAGVSTARDYDAAFHWTSSTNANNHSTNYVFSSTTGLPLAITDAGGFTTTMQYDGLNNPTLLTDTRNFTNAYVYSGTLLTRQSNALGSTAIYTYGLNNLLIAEQDPLGRVTRYEYNPFGQRIAMTNALTNTTRFGYDPVGRLITTTDAIGRVTVNAYDNADHLIAVTNNYTNTSLEQNYLKTYNLITRYGYDDFGHRIGITDTLNHVTRNYYDLAGHLISVTANFTTASDADPNVYNLKTWYGYDPLGHRILVTDTLLHVTFTEYDNLNHPVTVTRNYKGDGSFNPAKPDENVQHITHYDPVGNVIEQINPPDANGNRRVTRNWYDQVNHLICTTVNYNETPGVDPSTYNLTTWYEYDPAGNRVAITDTLQHVTRNYYDPLGRLISTTVNFTTTPNVDPAQYNLTTWYGYDTVGNQVAVTDTLLHLTRTEYDNLNRPVTVTQNYKGNGDFDPNKPDQNIKRIIHYDPAGNVLEQIDALGHVTRNWYDSLNRVISTTTNYTSTPGVDPNTYNLTTWYEYDPTGQEVAITDTLQHVTRNYYDPLGRLISTTVNYRSDVGPNYLNTYNLTTRYEYDRVGNRVVVTDAQNTPTRYEYDPLNRVIATTNVSGTTYTEYDAIGNRRVVTDALQHTTVYTYDAVGRLFTEGNPVIGNLTRYQYDALGRTIVVTDPLTHAARTFYDDAGRVVSTTNALTGTTVITYDALGHKVGVLNENGKPSYLEYDGLGRTVVMTDATGSVTRSKYDALGNRTQVFDGLSHPMTSTYDAANRLSMTQDALGNPTRYGYDQLGNRVVMTDANGVVTGYGHDALSRLVVVTESMTTTLGLDPAKYNVVTRYGYDALSNRIVMTDASQHMTTYTYDQLSRLMAMNDPLTHTARYQYDAVGNRVKVIDANNQTITYTYDALNRNTRIDYGTSTTAFEYDLIGNRTVMTDSLGTTRYVYDELNRLKQVTDPFTGTVQYRYDAVGNRTQLIYPDSKVVTYTFDAANRLTGTLSWDGQLTTYAFDPAGRLITTTLPNGVTEVKAYDDANRTTRLTQSRGGTTLADYQYTLDHMGNRITAAETVKQPATQSVVQATAVFTVAQSADDAYIMAARLGGTIDTTSPATAMGSEGLDQTEHAGYRFISVTLPAGAVLVKAELGLTAYADDSSELQFEIYGEDTRTPATYTTYNDFVRRALTTDFSVWKADGSENGIWKQNAEYFIDITKAASEIVQKYGADGQPMAFQVRYWGGSGTRQAWSFDGVADQKEESTIAPAHLRLTYQYTIATKQATLQAPAASKLPPLSTSLASAGLAGLSSVVDDGARLTAYHPDEKRSQNILTNTGIVTDAGWLTTVQENIRQAEYNVTWQEKTSLRDLAASYQAPNRAQNLRTYFTPAGIRVMPRAVSADLSEKSGAWEWGLTLAGYGYAGSIQPVTTPELAADGNRIEYRRTSPITEWYLNDPRGLEQGFTLANPPAQKVTGELVLELAVTGNLVGGMGVVPVSNTKGITAVQPMTVPCPNEQRDPLATQWPPDAPLPGGKAATTSATVTCSILVVPDGRAIDFTTADGVRVLRYSDLHATDATGRELPARMEWLSQRVRLIIDDRGAVYPVTIDPLASAPSWTTESNQVGAQLGSAVATAGDINGDGYGDVIIGAPSYDNGISNTGRAFVYYGSATGLTTTVGWTAENTQGDAQLGWFVGSAGDVNKDGYADIFVAAPYYDHGENDEGQVFVWYGSWNGLGATGTPTNAAWKQEGNQAGAHFGWSTSTAGDVNGDGYSDLIVAADWYSHGQAYEGMVYVYNGAASGLVITPSWTAESNQTSALFGISVGTAGDVNHDGYSDVMVSAPWYDAAQTDEGSVFVWYGSSSGLGPNGTPLNADWTAGGTMFFSDNFAGSSTAWTTVGGVWTRANGVYSQTSSASQSVKKAIISNSGVTFPSNVVITAKVRVNSWTDSDAARAGVSLFSNTSDGRGYNLVFHNNHSTVQFLDDMVTWGPSYTFNWTNGVWYWFSLKMENGTLYGKVWPDGTSEPATWPYTWQRSGRSGYPSLNGGSGNATVSFDDVRVASTSAGQPYAQLGYSVDTAGDVNGDGYADVIIGANDYDNGENNEGRAFVYHGSTSGLSASPNWTAESNLANAYFGVAVSTAGDVNGDGFADVIVGAHGIGRVFVYHGSSSGLSGTPNWIAESDEATSHFGEYVDTAGDVNRDGLAEVIVGADLYNGGQTDEGRAFVYYGTDKIGQWDMNEGTGSSTADSSGNAHTGTLLGATWTTGKVGSALHFAGNDHVTIPDRDDLDGLPLVTVMAWAKSDTSSNPSQYYTILAKGDDTYRLVVGSTGKFEFHMNTGANGLVMLNSNVTFNATDWFFVVGTYDGSACRLYVNGIERASQICSGTINSNSYDLWLGNNSQYSWRGWIGSIDQAALYSRALSAAEIQSIYTRLTPVANFTATPVSGLVPLTVTFTNASTGATSYLWNFGDGITSTAPDASGLVAAYPFDGNALDSSGHGHAGVVYGATLTSDRYGRANSAYYFNGTTNYIKVPAATDLNNLGSALSVVSWIKIDPGTNYNVYGYRHILSKGATYGSLYADFAVGLSNPQGALTWEYTNNSNAPFQGDTGTAVTQGVWHLVATTFNNGTINLYMDGALQATLTGPYTYTRSSTQPLYIGARYDSPIKGTFQGALDDIRLYNRALTTQEVQALYQQEALTFTHVYSEVNIYTVSLTAMGLGGSSILTRTNYITASGQAVPMPEAHFSGSPLIGAAPLTVTFTNTSTHALYYLWNFGDGMTGMEVNPIHVYTQPGVYTVILTAIGDAGFTNILTRSNYITSTLSQVPGSVGAEPGEPLSEDPYVNEEYPAVALNPDANEYLVTWVAQQPGWPEADLYARRMLPNNEPIGEVFAINTELGGQEPPVVAYGNGVYLVVWPSNNQILGQRVSATGDLLGGVFTINTSGDENFSPAIVYNSAMSEFLVVWVNQIYGGYRYIYGQRVAPDGTLLGSEIYLIGSSEPVSDPAIAIADNYYGYYLMVFACPDSHLSGICSLTMSSDGQSYGGQQQVYDGALNSSHPTLVRHPYDYEFLLVWQEGPVGGTEDVLTLRIDTSGYPLGTPLSLGAQTADPLRPSVSLLHSSQASYQQVYAVVWPDNRYGNWDIFAREVNLDGTLASNLMSIESTPDDQTFVVISPESSPEGCFGEEALVIYTDQRSGNPDLYSEQYDPCLDCTIPGLQANFSGAPINGTSPLTVTFTDQSSGWPFRWQWDFGDGYTSTLQNPIHTYLAPGIYTVTQNITQSYTCLSDAEVKTNYITATSSLPLTGTVVINYVYDPLYRLIEANYSTGEHFQYVYDAVGNRTVQTRTITSTQVITYQYDNANRMINAGGVAYTWDNNGNLINDGSADYLYDRANRMISTTVGGATSLYAYNGDGARLRQSIAGVPTTYTQDLVAPLPVVLQAQTGSATTQYLYTLGTRPLAQNGGAWEYLFPDALGSVRQIADVAGNVTLAESYEPYGTVLTSTGTASSIFGYAGEQADTTGLIYLRARYMNPTLGIFLARDPLMSASPYRYASSNPINRIDPSGYIDWQNCAIQGDYGTCTVTQGDWIYKIAREINAAGVSVNVPILAADIIALNPQIQWNPDYLQIGDRLTLRATWINAVLYGHAGPPAPTPQPPAPQPPVIDLNPWPLPPISLKEPDPNAPYYPPPPELLNGPVGYAIGWGGTIDYTGNGLPIPNPKVTIGTKCIEGFGKVGGFETVWDFRHLQKAEFHYDGIIEDMTILGVSGQYYEGWIYGLQKNIEDYAGWFATDFGSLSAAVVSAGGMSAQGLDDQGNLTGVKAFYGFVGAGLTANLGIDAGRSYTKYEIGSLFSDGINLRHSERIQFAEKFAEDFKTKALPVNGAITTYLVTNLIKAWGRYDWK